MRRGACALLLAGLINLCYLTIGHYVPAKAYAHIVSTPLDNMVPFVPGTVWYYIFGLYIPLLVAIWLIKDKDVFFRLCFSMLVGATVDFLFFLAIPIDYPRPMISAAGEIVGVLPYNVWQFSGDVISNKVVAFLYDMDAPSCTFPSSHITYAVCLALGFVHQSKKQSQVMWVVAFFLYVTTLTTKQHFVLDGVAGAITGYLAYKIAFYGVNEKSLASVFLRR